MFHRSAILSLLMLSFLIFWAGECLAQNAETPRTIKTEIITFAAFSEDNLLITTSYFQEKHWSSGANDYFEPITVCDKAELITWWDSTTGKMITANSRERLANAVLSPSGSHLLTWDTECTDNLPDGLVKIFDTQSYISHIHTIGGPVALLDVAFADKGRKFLVKRLSDYFDRELLPLEIWDVRSLKRSGTLSNKIEINRLPFGDSILYSVKNNSLSIYTGLSPKATTTIRAPASLIRNAV